MNETITALLGKLGEYVSAAEGLAPEVWDMLVAYERIEGVADMFVAILLGIATVFLYKACRKGTDMLSDGDDSGIPLVVVGGMGVVIAPILSILSGYSAIFHIFIPEVMALKEIMSALSGGGG